MKKVFILTILLILLAGTVSAYEITLDCPAQLQRGELLVVNGTTNLPTGTSFDVLFSNTEFRTNDPIKKTVTVQGYDNKSFSVTFATGDLKRGIYKVEIPPTGGYSFLGNSVTLRVVEIIDRSDEIEIRSPLRQYFTNLPGGRILKIAGIGQTLKDNGVQIEVTGPEGTVFGPAFIPTENDGSFSKEVSVMHEGTYTVEFADAKGDIGTVNFTMIPDIPATTVAVTAQETKASTPVLATAEASWEHPAFFAVTTGTGPVRVFTSQGVDWVIEYTDQDGKIQKINDMGQINAETVTVQGNGGVLNFMVYPYKAVNNGTVTLYAENAVKIEAVTSIPAAFANSTMTQTTATTTQKSPIPVIAFFAALALAFIAARKFTR
ncbi:MAG: hypothetical protein LUQ45_00005 [Methanoregulaceae archaeon]|nr:hypothetical protein [Methanoregulaceae archaeon]